MKKKFLVVGCNLAGTCIFNSHICFIICFFESFFLSAGQHTCAWLAFDFQYIDCRADHFLYQCKVTGTNYQT